MAGKKDRELTMVVPGLNRREAKELKINLIREKKRIAPLADASIAIGRKENFSKLAGSCIKRLGGD